MHEFKVEEWVVSKRSWVAVKKFTDREKAIRWFQDNHEMYETPRMMHRMSTPWDRVPMLATSRTYKPKKGTLTRIDGHPDGYVYEYNPSGG